MQKTRLFTAIALCGVAAAPLASLAAGADTFANGQSYYGQPTPPQAATPAVDLGSASRLNVTYGESVTFRSGGQLFTWTFNGLDRRAVDVNLDHSSPANGGLRILPGTHNKGMGTLLFHKFYYLNTKADKRELGLTVEPGDLTVHDGRIWHRVAQSPFIGEKSRRRVMYVPIISGKYQPRDESSKPLLYQRFASITDK